MKNVILSTIVAASILLSGSIQAKYIDPVTEDHLVKICKAIKSDSKIELRRAIKESGLGIQNITQGLVCNGADPVTFAIVNDAQKNARFLASRSGLSYEELVAKL
jgi:hypothetical protein